MTEDPNRHRFPATIGQIFIAFLRLGLTAFGGPAMVAYIRRMAVTEKNWLSESSFKHGIALCQTIPGATAMQAAAYAGLRAGGAWGGVAAYTAFGLPAFCLMLALTIIYSRSHELPAVISLFAGLQVIVVALIGNATINFGRKYLKNIRDIGLAILIAIFLGLGGSPVLAILSAALLALFLYRTDEHDRHHDGQTPVTGLSWSRMMPALNLAGACLGALLLLFVLDRTLFVLAVLMMKIDFFAFGGGFASVPLLFHEIVNVHHWMDNQTLMDGIALGQITPGPIVITATFAGYLLSGFAGAVVGTVFIFTPSLFLLFLVTPIFDRLQHSVLFQRGIRGILVSFVGLLLSVTIHFALTVHWQPVSVLIATAAFAALYRKVNILYVVLAGAAVSIFLL